MGILLIAVRCKGVMPSSGVSKNYDEGFWLDQKCPTLKDSQTAIY